VPQAQQQRSTSTPDATSRPDRRQTGGERPATSRQQPTHNDSKRQGRSRSRSITAGHATAVLVFTQQWSVPGDGVGVERLPPTARPWGGGLPEWRTPVGEPATVIPVVPAKVLGPRVRGWLRWP
jgi:hypothetical protein